MILLALVLAAQSTTDCYQNGVAVNCTTRGTQTAPDPLQSFVQGMQQDNREQAQRNEMAQQASANRRAAAYSQVGELIAKGDCVAANRLASFYGQRDIVKDTARACPIGTEAVPKK